jgi:hypothetical protein
VRYGCLRKRKDAFKEATDSCDSSPDGDRPDRVRIRSIPRMGVVIWAMGQYALEGSQGFSIHGEWEVTHAHLLPPPSNSWLGADGAKIVA